MSNISNNSDGYLKREEWLEYISRDDAPISHKMFTCQSYFDSFWERCDHGILILDENCNVIEANPYFLDLIGSNLTEIKNKSLQDVVSERTIVADYTNITSIIKANQYSYETNTEVNYKFKGVKLIPVKLIASRVPSTLNLPFQHVIVHIYEIKDAFVYTENDYICNKSWGELLKIWFSKGWFTKWLLVLLTIIILILGYNGNLLDFIQMLFGAAQNTPTT